MENTSTPVTGEGTAPRFIDLVTVRREPLKRGFRFIGVWPGGGEEPVRKQATRPYTHVAVRRHPGLEHFLTFHSSITGARSTPYNQVVDRIIDITE